MQKYLTITEAAEILRLSNFATTKLCRDGKLEAFKPGGQWRITEEAITAYIESAPNVGAA